MNKETSPHWPACVRGVYRFLRYSSERTRVIQNIPIRRAQNSLIGLQFAADTKKLIVFVVPGRDWASGKEKISGGIISMVSFCEQTAMLGKIHGAKTIMCTVNGACLLVKHSLFDNQTMVYRFEQLNRHFRSLDELIIHIPEFLTDFFIDTLSNSDLAWLRSVGNVQINVMNQNIRLMPPSEVLQKAGQLARRVTITTAHEKYCTPYFRSYFGVPLHKLSVWISPENYKFRSWSEKENLLVISPDEHPLKESVMALLRRVQGLKIQVIQGLTYSEYKDLISRARWTLTFGEGLDGYLIEPIFSGAVGFAVYNEDFFTADFADLSTVYPSMDSLKQNMILDMANLDNDRVYSQYQQRQFDLCARYYSKEQYEANIIAFYTKQYVYG